MVKILLIHDGGEQASWMQSHLSEYLQIELWSVSSIPDGEELYQNIFPDVVLLPLSLRTECDLESIVCWQRRCTTVHGSRPGFLFYVIHHNDLIFFDISQGSTLISLQTSDALKQVITLMRQVAGRSKVERSLREDYDHHNRIISTMPLASMEVQGGMIGWVNPAFLRLIGHDIHEIIGTPPSKWISSVQDVSGDQLSSSPVTMEGSIWAWGNEEIPCRITVHPTKSAVPGDGIWFIEDRREYASLLSLLKETEYRCQEQLYLAETMVIRLLPDGIISFANQAAARCFGYESDILIGNPVSVLFPAGAGIGENLAELFLEVSDESSSALHIIEHRKRDGKRLWVSWMSRGLYTPDNDLAGIICVGTDMTEMAADGRERISTRVWRDRILMETDIQPDVFDSVLQACMEIGREGREGKPVGTAFLVGDSETVMRLSRQLILNPFVGHPPELRMVSVPDVREMLKEYALLDGAFVVRGDGLLEAAGRYITVDTSIVTLPKGMGTRHSSVAAITCVTDAVGFVVSESGGRVSIIKKGKIVKVIA